MNTWRGWRFGLIGYPVFFLSLWGGWLHADVKVQVTLKGTPNSQDETFVAAASGCGESPVRHTENWKIGAQGGLADVVVWLTNSQPASTPASGTAKAQINQLGCRYVPHVIVSEAGVPVVFSNGDRTLHNVRAQISNGAAQPPGETVFNFGQSYQGQKDERQFDEPGIYTLRCDVHSWMQAWVLVLVKNSYFGVTGTDGVVQLPSDSSLADGDYKIQAWHAKFAVPLEQTAHLKNGAATVNFQFDATQSL